MGGGLNTDMIRGSYQTAELVKFVGDQSSCMCANDPCCTIEYTYCSTDSGVTSLNIHTVVQTVESLLILTISY